MATETEERRKREERLGLLLLLLMSTTEDDLRSLIRQLTAGAHPVTFGAAMLGILLPAHAHAAYLGRQLAGNTIPFGHHDMAFAQTVIEEQKPFVDGFVQDIQGGEMSEPQIEARAVLYSNRLLGTANEAWGLSLSPDVHISWVLEPEAVHCATCPALAANGPYTIDTLPTFPARGDTQCSTNCRCWLSTDTGQKGFDLLTISKRYDA